MALVTFLQGNWQWIGGGLAVAGGVVAFVVGRWDKLRERRETKIPVAPVTIDQANPIDLAELLVANAEAKGRAEAQLADRDQQIQSLTAALAQAKAVEPTLDAARRSPDDKATVSLETAQEFATAAEDVLLAFFEKKKAEGAQANREAAATARHIGSLAFLHDTQKALRFFGEATELDPGEDDGWNQLGHLLRRTGDLAGAERAYKRVLQLGNSIGDKAVIAIAYGNLGTVYQTQGDFVKAEEFYKKSLALEEALGRKEGMASDYRNLGLVYQTQGDLVKACESWQQALALYQTVGIPEGVTLIEGWMRDAGCSP